MIDNSSKHGGHGFVGRLLDRISLNAKLAIILLTALVGLGGMIGFTMLSIERLSSLDNEMTAAIEQKRDVAAMQRKLNELIRQLDRYLLTGDGREFGPIVARSMTFVSSFTAFIKIAKEDHYGSAEYIEKQMPLIHATIASIREVYSLQRSGDTRGAIALRTTELRAQLTKVGKFVATVEKAANESAKEVGASTHATLRQIRLLTLGVSAAILLVILLMIRFIARSITRNTGRLTAEMGAIAKSGETHLRVTIPPGPEFSIVGSAFNSVMDRIEESERSLKQAHQDLSDSQMQVLQAERLSVLGRVTATVSHEIRNPLGAIRNSLFIIREAAEAKGLNLSRPLDRMQRSVARCDSIIGDLLEYTRTKELSFVNVGSAEYLNDLLNEQAIPDGISLERNLPDPGPQIAVDQDRFPRIMINLVENAGQAIKESGAEEGKITVSCEELDGGKTAVRVTDDGPGIPDDVLAKIFEPLFTTKSFGAGLGLPTVKQLVEQHGAELTIETEVGVGTTFSVVLPNAADAAMQKEADAA